MCLFKFIQNTCQIGIEQLYLVYQARDKRPGEVKFFERDESEAASAAND